MPPGALGVPGQQPQTRHPPSKKNHPHWFYWWALILSIPPQGAAEPQRPREGDAGWDRVSVASWQQPQKLAKKCRFKEKKRKKKKQNTTKAHLGFLFQGLQQPRP